MFVERPPLVYRCLYKDAVWRAARYNDAGQPLVYLTIDDGPTPESTPGVLDILRRHNVPAVFFMVADNARRYPALFAAVKAAGHAVGNHTCHHLQGLFVTRRRYMADVAAAAEILGPTRFFRPPHGLMRRTQYKAVSRTYRVVMQDIVSRDYDRTLTPERVIRNVTSNVRPGSVIVFHDSEKSASNVLNALEPTIIALREMGYCFALLND